MLSVLLLISSRIGNVKVNEHLFSEDFLIERPVVLDSTSSQFRDLLQIVSKNFNFSLPGILHVMVLLDSIIGLLDNFISLV